MLVSLWLTVALQTALAQQSHKPLSEKDVIGLLTNDVPPARVEGFAREFGISFQVTPAVESDLRDAGATDELIQTLRNLAPKPPAPKPEPPRTEPAPKPLEPPVLLIQSQPGDAHVYVDDVPVGTTSSEGRLKLPNLSRGTHRIRVSLSGYRDFEQSVELTSGNFSVLAHLQKPQPIAFPSSPEHTTPAVTSSGAPGVLGIFLRQSPGGGRGLMAIALMPGSPAEEAGVRPGAVLYSIAGHPLQTLENVKQAMAGHPAGDSVEVTWALGGIEHSARIRLSPSSIYNNAPHFWVLHDHGPPAPNYCLGWMTVLDGMVMFVGQRGVSPGGSTGEKHTFEFLFTQIKEIKRNAVYMAAQHAFHIRTVDNKVANFIVLDPQGKPLPSEELIADVERAMAKY